MKERMYTVYVTRTERYSLPYNVLAFSGDDACERVKRMDDNDEFVDFWNELQPEVETDYSAEEAAVRPDEPEGVPL